MTEIEALAQEMRLGFSEMRSSLAEMRAGLSELKASSALLELKFHKDIENVKEVLRIELRGISGALTDHINKHS